MKRIFGSLSISSLLFLSACDTPMDESVLQTNEKVDITEKVEERSTEKILLSPRMETKGLVGEKSIVIDYGAPSVRGREIWGELVAYDKVWRAGANETTAITFKNDVKINNKNIPAGTYGFFIIPRESGDWTVIFNEEWSREEHDAWGSSHYKEVKDVLRFDVAPLENEESVELLTYTVTPQGISFAWEKIKLELKIG